MLGAYQQWFDQTTVTGNDRELLRAICEHASGDFGMCIASQKRLAWDIGGVRRQTVNASLARLVGAGYVEKIGETNHETLQLIPCLSRPADRDPMPPDPCPQSGQPLFPTNPDGSAILTPVRKADMSEKRTQIRELVKSERPVDEGESEESNSSNNKPTVNARARKNLTAAQLAREFNEEFWPNYPRKTNKGAARTAFPRARRKATLDEILAGLGRSIAYWSKRGNVRRSPAGGLVGDQFVPHPSTWLNGECWEDELLAAPTDQMTSSTDAGRAKAAAWSGGGS